MPLTPGAEEKINNFLRGAEGENINKEINKIVRARNALRSLLEIHGLISNEAAANVLSQIKEKAKVAAETIVTLLS